ncbi:ABC transporter ATP-binding protein [Streptomyces sp. NBC_00377]|uniref:ABC transporter ATP-binding protein n=1 Tax=unclassified Streptomyces TaxID=2593676 RepID=UPI002E1D36A6|nr:MULTISPECIES: ABC transporter ATP-binding protein [unclassified Streptomyces]
MTKVISVSGLQKRFGRTHALNGLDLEVEAGEVHGFLGPNGSGKSTTIRVLLGLLRADSGAARMLGMDPWADAVELHGRIAYVPGDVTLWRNLTGGEVIDLYGRLHAAGRTRGGRAERRRTGGLNPARRADLIERFELDPTKKGRTYSKGNRQKVALIAAFASDVDVLILDEPTSGLDPLMEEVFRRCVREERDRGRTVLLSSHILSEVEELCDRVSIIRKGRTVESGSLADLRHLTRTSVTAELSGGPGALETLPGVHGLDVQDAGVLPDGVRSRVRLQVDTEHLNAVLRSLADSGVRSLTSAPPTLEELFLQHYRDEDEGEDQDAALRAMSEEAAAR